jgi:hypothetical protein
VDLVLKVMDAYLEGDFTSVPNNSTAAGYVVPEPPSFKVDGPKNTKGGAKNNNNGGSTGGSGSGTGGDSTGGGDTGGGTGGGGTGGGGTGGGGTGGLPGGGTGGGGTTDPVKEVTKVVEEVDKGVGTVTSNLIGGVLGLLTKAEAQSACTTAFPKLTQTVQLLNCLLSYGIGK